MVVEHVVFSASTGISVFDGCPLSPSDKSDDSSRVVPGAIITPDILVFYVSFSISEFH